ncbi:MAG: serine hydrolase [Syntrophobacterales bacterium]|nr:serine hydrolase [Syntrophobacterales bacterium]
MERQHSRGRVYSFLKKALEEKLFTAVAMIVSLEDRILFEAYLGKEEEKGDIITNCHLFDLASLTKPIVTATGFMKLCSDGILDLSDPLHYFFPRRWIHPKLRDLPIWAILSHAGGWKDYEPFYRELAKIEDPLPLKDSSKNKKEYLLKLLLETPPIFEPLRGSRYSDLGYILLGFILEDLTGMALDSFWEDLSRSLPISLLYLPTREPKPSLNDVPKGSPQKIVSTGWCSWRRRWLKGEVHDENCFAMGGVAGHAGLFGTAEAVRSWLVELFMAWKNKRSSLFIRQGVVRRFWERCKEVPNSTWALGFDTPSPKDSTTGKLFSPKSIGHLGFTGTSFWLDLSDGFSVILLSNRVYYPGTKERMKHFRTEIHNLARIEYGDG